MIRGNVEGFTLAQTMIRCVVVPWETFGVFVVLVFVFFFQ